MHQMHYNYLEQEENIACDDPVAGIVEVVFLKDRLFVAERLLANLGCFRI